MYMTGDFVKYDSNDKNIYFICRKDNQIKHMGYRIELDEIEHALNQIDGVSESVTIHASLYNVKQIIAFVALKSDYSFNSDELKKELRQMIPSYMVPSKINFLKNLPKNANGKIDRTKLSTEFL